MKGSDMRARSLCVTVGFLAMTAHGAAEPVPGPLRLESQLTELKDILKGRRVGLFTNPSGVDSDYNLVADRLHADPRITLVCFFAPEHGLRGDRQAGEKVADYVDSTTGLPVYSLYGVRTAPEPDHLADLDVVVCDLQDVGTRFYTRAWIMARAMEATGRAGKAFVVFDRPNANGLARVEGPPIPFDAGIIGPVWPGQPFGVPTRHGMTLGEIATLVNTHWTEHAARLKVVRVPGYTRTMTFEQTGYPWVMPSPNMPTLETAAVYPGTCVFEATNLSEGRGTTRPFELVGAPFIDAPALAVRLNEAHLPGVRFRPAWFTPTFSKHEGELCAGVQVHVTDREAFEPIRTGLTMLKLVFELHPQEVIIREAVSRRAGVPNLHDRIKTESVDAIIESWQDDLQAFDVLRRSCLLYE